MVKIVWKAGSSGRREKLTAINRPTNFDGNPFALEFFSLKMSIFCFKNLRTQHVIFSWLNIMQRTAKRTALRVSLLVAVSTAVAVAAVQYIGSKFMCWWRDLRPQKKICFCQKNTHTRTHFYQCSCTVHSCLYLSLIACWLDNLKQKKWTNEEKNICSKPIRCVFDCIFCSR